MEKRTENIVKRISMGLKRTIERLDRNRPSKRISRWMEKCLEVEEQSLIMHQKYEKIN